MRLRDLDDNDVQEETVHFNPVATPLDECERFNVPPSANTRSALKRNSAAVNDLDPKRPRLVSSKRKLEAPSSKDQKRQRLEAIELAALFCV